MYVDPGIFSHLRSCSTSNTIIIICNDFCLPFTERYRQVNTLSNPVVPSNVLYGQPMTKNLFSVSQFIEDHYSEVATFIHYSGNINMLQMNVNLISHARSKHIELDFYYVCARVAHKLLQTEFVSSKDQIAVSFTESFPRD